ncbi:MAG: uridine kinase [Defluviitaleaceae bacterium]|nr:uridine kinase [Defluviitaleaceae bacterium]
MRSPLIIAIDGRSAAGKTTLANKISDAVIHIDDFFLPKNLRTPEREINFHHERFACEVLPFLRGNEAFSYKIFDCARGDFFGERKILPAKIRVVEGSYSHHPILGEYMDLRVFCDIDAHSQITRIESRNGKISAKVFSEKWIPSEEKYFFLYDIKEKSDIVL